MGRAASPRRAKTSAIWSSRSPRRWAFTLKKVALVESASTLPTGEPGPRKARYSLAELMAQCDVNSPLSTEDQAWIDAPAIGREA